MNPQVLQGLKTLLSALIWIGVVIVALVTGHDLRPIAEGVAKSVGWGTPTGADWAFYLLLGNTILAAWGSAGKLWVAYQHWRAGVPVGEVLAPIGYVKAAIARGLVGIGDHGPVLKG